MNDLRYAIRQLLKHPGFTAVAVLTLALGVGVNATVFMLLNSVFLRPLPGLSNAGSLVIAGRTHQGQFSGGSSYPDYKDCQRLNTVFSDLAAASDTALSVSADNSTERLLGEIVSGNYFRTLGVTLAAGRDFLDDDAPGGERVAVISYRYWERRWGCAPEVIGKPVVINGHSFVIIGVAARRFRGAFLPTAHDLWIPLHTRPLVNNLPGDCLGDRSYIFDWRFIGRLKSEVNIAQANDNLRLVGDQLAQAYAAENRTHSFGCFAYNPAGLAKASQILAFIGVLAVITGLVLAVICANVASLFLARAFTRQREIAIRLAIGASRPRVIAQLLGEAGLVALAGAGLGVVLSFWGVDALFSGIPGDRGETAALDFAVDWRVIGFAGVLAGLSTFASGLLPALQASCPNLISTLKAGESAHTRPRSRLHSALIVTQVACCVVLIVCGGLLFRSLYLLHQADPRMRIDNLVLATLDPGLNGYDAERAERFFSRVLEGVRGLPGVESASMARIVPFGGQNVSIGPLFGGRLNADAAFQCNVNLVGPEYFQTVGILLVRGRDILDTDRRDRPRVTVINETLARRFWQDADPLGQLVYLKQSDTNPPLAMAVVGVVSDSTYADSASRNPIPFYYVPQAQHPQRAGLEYTLHIRTRHDPASFFSALRRTVAELDPHLPLFRIQTMKTVRDQSFFPYRIATTLVGFAGALTLFVATLGLYAVMSQHVAQRTREIGIRVALGATRVTVIRTVLKRGFGLCLMGWLLGTAMAVVISRTLTSLLFGVEPTDPFSFLAAAEILGVTAALASYWPARRAAKIDPMEALRYE